MNLNEIFKFVSKHNFTFVYKKDENEGNSVEYELTPEKKITINISDQDDINLDKMLRDKLKELEDRLK